MGFSRMPMAGLPLPGRLLVTRARSHIPPFILSENHRLKKWHLVRDHVIVPKGRVFVFHVH